MIRKQKKAEKVRIFEENCFEIIGFGILYAKQCAQCNFKKILEEKKKRFFFLFCLFIDRRTSVLNENKT